MAPRIKASHPGPAPVTVMPMALSHVAMNTADLDRFRAFYEDVIGLRTAIVLRMTEPPGLRHAILSVNDTTIIHAFERPGYDPGADGIGTEVGSRGRLDHIGFLLADLDDLKAVRDRLVAVRASEGVVSPLGPLLSVLFRDPDGLEGEINTVNPAFDLSLEDRAVVEEEPDPGLHHRLVAACSRG
ncbi:MAG: VOC family protein [Acidimicrobiales bacterium]